MLSRLPFDISKGFFLSSGIILRFMIFLILVGKPEEKRPLGRQDISGWIILKYSLRRYGWGGMSWIYLA
jgi:hypothetical protein